MGPTEKKRQAIMFSSLKLGKAFGIGIFVHWSFFLLPAWVLLSNFGLGGWPLAFFALVVVLAVFGCVVLHELGHAMMARRFGIPTRDITLYPIGGVARLERMSEKPWEEFWIAVAGPAVNVVIAGLLAFFLIVSGDLSRVVALPDLGLVFLNLLMWINVGLVIFNLVPAFPMDGGRVLRALLALRLGQLRATQVAVNVALVIIGVVFMLLIARVPFVTNSVSVPSLVLIAAFVYFAGQQELASVYHREQERLYQYWTPSRQPYGQGFGTQSSERGRSPAVVYLWDDQHGVWVQRPLRRTRVNFEAE
jgi:Zn-dependent protease